MTAEESKVHELLTDELEDLIHREITAWYTPKHVPLGARAHVTAALIRYLNERLEMPLREANPKAFVIGYLRGRSPRR